MLNELKYKLHSYANPEKAKLLQRFFKTGKGEYGEGDIFIGVKVPDTRKVVNEFWNKINLEEIQELLNSKIHEERLCGILILVKKYSKEKNTEDKEKIFHFYLKNFNRINNWDLVDLSAPNIVGDFVFSNPKFKERIYEFANSENLWKKRIAILSTFKFIRENDTENKKFSVPSKSKNQNDLAGFDDSLKLAKHFLDDKHDLIHKAVGWMLREIGKRNEKILEEFLKKNFKKMPRTMLRYAIEKFEEGKRKEFLKK